MKAKTNRPQKRRKWQPTDEQRRIYNRRYNRKHSARRRELQRIYREANPGYSTGISAAWRKKNPDYHKRWKHMAKLKKAWLKFTRACAGSRARLSATPPQQAGRTL